MSSHSIRLAKCMRQLQNIRNVQKASTKTEDHYMVGMFNGIELALSIITDKEPVYLDCTVKAPAKEEKSDYEHDLEFNSCI